MSTANTLAVEVVVVSAGTAAYCRRALPSVSTARDKITSQHVTGEGSLFDVPPAAIGRFRSSISRSGHVRTCFCAAIPTGRSPCHQALHSSTSAGTAGQPRGSPGRPRGGDAAEGVGRDADGGGGCAGTPIPRDVVAEGDSLDVALKQFGPAAIPDLVPRVRTLAWGGSTLRRVEASSRCAASEGRTVSETDTILTGFGAWPILSRAGERLPMRRPYRAPELWRRRHLRGGRSLLIGCARLRVDDGPPGALYLRGWRHGCDGRGPIAQCSDASSLGRWMPTPTGGFPPAASSSPLWLKSRR